MKWHLDSTAGLVGQLLEAASVQPQFVVSYVDVDPVGLTATPAVTKGTFGGTTPQTLLAAPASGKLRIVNNVSVYNGDGSTLHDVLIGLSISSTTYAVCAFACPGGQTVNTSDLQQTVPIPLSYLSTDGTMAADSNVLVPSQAAVVTYASNLWGNVTNTKQVKGLSSGTTSGHVVTWGADGYTVADGGAINATLVGLGNVTNNAQVQLGTFTALGDTVYGSGSAAVTKLAGNTTSTRKFLRQVGNGSASAAPAWDTLQFGDLPTNSLYHPPAFQFSNGGSALATGLANTAIFIPYAATLVGVYLCSPDSTSGSATVDIIRANAAVPTSGNSIVGGGTMPAISSGTYAKVTSFSGWTATTFAANDVVSLNLTAVSTLKYLSVGLVLQVTG